MAYEAKQTVKQKLQQCSHLLLAVGAELLPPGGGLRAVQRYSLDQILHLQLQMDQSCSSAA